MLEVSIVSGTYNRLRYLIEMVDSVRKSVGILEYEIILVDGGSNDGTIQWCKQQKDVKLIAQGQLLGAVKAFNAGAEAALGRYVILANDDIVFNGYGIQAAVVFMDSNPTVGIGCFSQNRYSSSYTVGKMPAIQDGHRVSVPYGQVCIVQRWLGDMVGWWGDYLKTYGGDNELSCNVYELGFKVQEVPGASINDKILNDNLRAINNPVKKGEPNPDSLKWSAKWSRPEGLGPYIRTFPVINAQIPVRQRLLYLPIYERGRTNSLQKQYKFGLRNALRKNFMTFETDYVTKGCQDAINLAEISNPNIVLTQIQEDKAFPIEWLQKLKEKVPEAVFINWNGDYHPHMLQKSSYVEILKLFDLATFVTTNFNEFYAEHGIDTKYWQISYEACNKLQITLNGYDVVFLGNCYSGARKSLGKLLTGIKGIRLGLYGMGWEASGIVSRGSNLYDVPQQDMLYRASKISIGDCQWPESEGYVSNRLFQQLYSGIFVLQQTFKGMQELLGFEDGKHLVTWSSMDELPDLIKYWLDGKQTDKRNAIAKEGHDYCINNHSFDHRVEELKGWIQTIQWSKQRKVSLVTTANESSQETNS